MSDLFADRMATVHRSFIREILKVTEDPEIISFAGGLPNPRLFPVREIAEAASRVLGESGENVLQYSTTEGYRPLREYVARRYWERGGLQVDPDEVLITNGSQQGLDLISKVLLNAGDRVLLERPAYLGAIQAFSLFQPTFVTVPLLEDGIEIDSLKQLLTGPRIKLVYGVPNFQNPSGISYSRRNRMEVAAALAGYETIFVEDDPYGELRFAGEELPSMRSYLGGESILLGSFSKTVSPGLRLGWVCARREIMDRLVIAKQASDLHSNYLSQRVVHRYLVDNEPSQHIAKIREAYGRQRDFMLSAIARHCPSEVRCTRPEGGMFIWMTLPEGFSSLKLLDIAVEEGVAFVPGTAFYVDGDGDRSMRLNFSNSDGERIEEGVVRLARAIDRLLAGGAVAGLRQRLS